jgi:hypothetical protein
MLLRLIPVKMAAGKRTNDRRDLNQNQTYPVPNLFPARTIFTGSAIVQPWSKMPSEVLVECGSVSDIAVRIGAKSLNRKLFTRRRQYIIETKCTPEETFLSRQPVSFSMTIGHPTTKHDICRGIPPLRPFAQQYSVGLTRID